jgi:hypothetical protein
MDRIENIEFRKLEVQATSFNSEDNNDASVSRQDTLLAAPQLLLRFAAARQQAFPHDDPIETHMVHFI